MASSQQQPGAIAGEFYFKFTYFAPHCASKPRMIVIDLSLDNGTRPRIDQYQWYSHEPSFVGLK